MKAAGREKVGAEGTGQNQTLAPYTTARVVLK